MMTDLECIQESDKLLEKLQEKKQGGFWRKLRGCLPPVMLYWVNYCGWRASQGGGGLIQWIAGARPPIRGHSEADGVRPQLRSEWGSTWLLLNAIASSTSKESGADHRKGLNSVYKIILYYSKITIVIKRTIYSKIQQMWRNCWILFWNSSNVQIYGQNSTITCKRR